MSVYESRYQTNDDGNGRDAINSNGYVSSSSRTFSSANTGLRATNLDSQQQEISSGGQFYTSNTSSSTSVVVTGTTVSLSNGSVNCAPSVATLCNIGNTCYLNSVVYTLRFAPRFLHNLHHLIMDLGAIQQNFLMQHAKSSSLGRGITSMNMEHARSWSSKDLASADQYNTGAITGGIGNLAHKSVHQALTERLHELYQSLRQNEIAESTEPFHADTLLHAVQDVSAIFEGNQQQDAHEFLMCVLNSVRETCQTMLKGIVESPGVVLNGCISSANSALQSNEIMDVHEKDVSVNNYTSAPSSTKTSLFSRKPKRKDDTKNSKNSRVQSPLKDIGSVIVQQQHQQPTSNSLFYLNMVDLSGASSALPKANLVLSATSPQITANICDDASLLKERLAARIQELSLDFFSEDFEGVTVSTTKCLSCETVTEQKESMIDIAVPVPISGYDSAEFTEKPGTFIQNSCITREYFRGENKYRCEQCTGYTEAIRSISYEVLPRLLVIQLSRFSGGMEKINSYIPTSFTLQCFCAKCCSLSDANKLHIYKLYSVITHVGATMSVGHYIAYTCSLDWPSEYVNCPKDRRTQSQEQQSQSNNNAGSSSSNNGSALTERLAHVTQSSSSAASAAASAFASSGTNLIKKMKFVRNKASSSGDMSKNVKNINGITSKSITNGIGQLNINTTCHSVNCCATRLQQQQNLPTSDTSNELSEEALQNGSNHNNSVNSTYNNFSVGYGSTGRGGSAKNSLYATSNNSNTITPGSASSAVAEPIWYMCDDDKIKAMTQREFEELLSPSRKITITPYLLFYARFDLQPTASANNSKTTVTTATPQSSWCSESIKIRAHKM